MSKAGFSRKPRVYVPKCRKGDTPQPAFTLRRLSPLDLLDITEKYSDENETIELGGITEGGESKEKSVKISLKTLNRFTRSKYAVLELALSGWENVFDEEDEPIPFSKEAIPFLDPDVVAELSDIAQGAIGEIEVKNSVAPRE